MDNNTTGLAHTRKPLLLVRGVEWRMSELEGAINEHFDVHFAESDDAYQAMIDGLGPRVDALVTNGMHGLSAHQMEKLPRLRIIHCRGAGTENIDLQTAKQKGIVVTSGAGANAFVVADQAMALLLAAVRSTVRLDVEARAERFDHASARPLPSLSGKRIGIAGLGNIGLGIARRAEGFDMEVGYFTRTAKQDLSYRHFSTMIELAGWCDFLVIALPGGNDTRNLVGSEVLQALGGEGYLVNVARGAIVDTTALVHALNAGTIAGAALDVWEGEPKVDAALLSAANLTLSPHVGGFAEEAAAATFDRMLQNLQAFFNGRALVSRLV